MLRQEAQDLGIDRHGVKATRDNAEKLSCAVNRRVASQQWAVKRPGPPNYALRALSSGMHAKEQHVHAYDVTKHVLLRAFANRRSVTLDACRYGVT